jgi:hypothetical protein
MSRGTEMATHLFSETKAMTKISRAAIALIGIAVWFVTQSLLASRGFPNDIGDGLHLFLSPLTEWLAHHDTAANILLIATSAAIDFLGLLPAFCRSDGIDGSPLARLVPAFCPATALSGTHRSTGAAKYDLA